MTGAGGTAPGHQRSAGIVRSLIGLIQGLALYALFEAFKSKSWPATEGPLFASLCTTFIFVPLIVASGLTHLRYRTLIVWGLITALLCASLAYYDIIRDPIVSGSTPRNLPSAQLWFALCPGLFISHNLLISGANDHRFIARYPTLYDVSWKHGLQILLACLFAVIFWLLLWLGAELFSLIEIDFLSRLIRENWFWIPATTLALNYALYATDVRADFIRSIRALSAYLLSWLLPLMALIVSGFIAALPFTGLEPLWSTRRASLILLAASASLIFLINAAYQDGDRSKDGSGDETNLMSRLPHFAMIAAFVVLVPLVILAAYGITSRVMQYGWTPQRVVAAACTIVAACYAIGYIFAALGKHSLVQLEATNVTAAFVALAILLALFTPLADPARISVADQIQRLNAGTIAPDKFDYLFLRFGSGRYGSDALQKLAEDGSTVIAQKAAEAQRSQNRYNAQRAVLRPTAQELTRNITVAQPVGALIPQEFLDADWSSSQRNYLLPSCLTNRAKCDAVLTDFDGDGVFEIILLPSPSGRAAVFRKNDQQSWSFIGDLTGMGCPGIHGAIVAGNFELAPSTFKDLSVNGQRLHLSLAPCTTQ